LKLLSIGTLHFILHEWAGCVSNSIIQWTQNLFIVHASLYNLKLIISLSLLTACILLWFCCCCITTPELLPRLCIFMFCYWINRWFCQFKKCLIDCVYFLSDILVILTILLDFLILNIWFYLWVWLDIVSGIFSVGNYSAFIY
jgi:hypothetical protein